MVITDKRVEEEQYKGAKNLGHLTFEGTTWINYSAFKESDVKSVVIPRDCGVSDEAFMDCQNLTEITIHGNAMLGRYALSDIPNVKKVTFIFLNGEKHTKRFNNNLQSIQTVASGGLADSVFRVKTTDNKSYQVRGDHVKWPEDYLSKRYGNTKPAEITPLPVKKEPPPPKPPIQGAELEFFNHQKGGFILNRKEVISKLSESNIKPKDVTALTLKGNISMSKDALQDLVNLSRVHIEDTVLFQNGSFDACRHIKHFTISFDSGAVVRELTSEKGFIEINRLNGGAFELIPEKGVYWYPLETNTFGAMPCAERLQTIRVPNRPALVLTSQTGNKPAPKPLTQPFQTQ